jgi:hypothetical protein
VQKLYLFFVIFLLFCSYLGFGGPQPVTPCNKDIVSFSPQSKELATAISTFSSLKRARSSSDDSPANLHDDKSSSTEVEQIVKIETFLKREFYNIETNDPNVIKSIRSAMNESTETLNYLANNLEKFQQRCGTANGSKIIDTPIWDKVPIKDKLEPVPVRLLCNQDELILLKEGVGRGANRMQYNAIGIKMGREGIALTHYAAALPIEGKEDHWPKEKRTEETVQKSLRQNSIFPDGIQETKVVSLSETGGFILSPFMRGGNLRRANLDSPHKILRALYQASVGLSNLHARNVVHRDLKPENMLTTEDGNTTQIADLGLATSTEALPGKEPVAGAPGICI